MAAEQPFDVYQPAEDQQTIRQAVHDVCWARVVPNAAEADETGEFPRLRTMPCGQAVADFQGIQFMNADMGMKLEAARQLT